MFLCRNLCLLCRSIMLIRGFRKAYTNGLMLEEAKAMQTPKAMASLNFKRSVCRLLSDKWSDITQMGSQQQRWRIVMKNRVRVVLISAPKRMVFIFPVPIGLIPLEPLHRDFEIFKNTPIMRAIGIKKHIATYITLQIRKDFFLPVFSRGKQDSPKEKPGEALPHWRASPLITVEDMAKIKVHKYATNISCAVPFGEIFFLPECLMTK